MNWFRQLFSRRRIYADLSREISEHLEEKVDELVALGMSPEDALAAARREFGNPALLEERGREVWQWSTVENTFRDLRHALRQLRRNPGFTLTVIFTLTLAVGANTAVFSMVNALLLRPLPFSHPERLAGLTRHLTGITSSGKAVDDSDDGQDGETWELVRDNVPSVLPTAFSYDASGVNLEIGNQARYVQNHRVSASYFEVLGLKPLLGRSFTPEEDRPKGPNAVILSYELWQSLFSGDRSVLGQSLRLRGEPYTIVGVMPAHIVTTSPADLWTPLQPWRGGEGGGDNYQIVMRLREGATWTEVNSQLGPLHPAMFDQLMKSAKKELVAMPLQKDLAQEKRRPTLILMSAVGFILLIAAANLAGLMLVRISRRSSEIATRLALGATRAAILRQTIMEPLVLTVTGTATGLAIAWLSMGSFTRMFPPDMLPLGGVEIDFRVFIFTALCMVLTGIFIAIFPALATKTTQIRPSLSGRSSEAGARSGRTRQFLIAAEVSLTLVLLAGAGLLVRTLVYLQNLPAGFDAGNVLSAHASLDDARYHDPAAFQKLIQESLTAMQKIPGVDSSAVGLSLPYERGLNDGFKVLDGPRAGYSMASSSSYVTPDYFRVLRVPLLAGRSFADGDTTASEPVALVNASFAQKHLGTTDVIGLHLGFGKNTRVIVGLVGDVKKRPGISVNAPLSTEPMYYVPFTQLNGRYLEMIHVWFQPSWIVRTRAAIPGLSESMQQALAAADPRLPFASFRQLDELQSLALSQQHLEVRLLTILAALALLMSVVGIYGLVSNLVVQRTREIGIRMALGCTPRKATVQVAGSGLLAVAVGVVIGLVLAALALPVLKNEIYGVRNLDPLTLAAVSFILLLAALLASFVPARRITRIDPAATLRSE